MTSLLALLAATSTSLLPSIPHARRASFVVLRAEPEVASKLPYAQLMSLRAAGDAGALLIFAAIGRGNHNSADGSALTTALPFIITWALLAPWLGAYKSVGTRTEALLAPLPTIVASVPLGCALRGVLQGYQPPMPFWIVALLATTVLIEAWRAVHYEFDSVFDKFADAIVDDEN